MATFAAPSGAWTTITGLDTTAAGKTQANLPTVGSLNLESLKTDAGVVLPELDQFVQFVADGYGIGFWHAWALVTILMRSRQGVPDPAITRVVG